MADMAAHREGRTVPHWVAGSINLALFAIVCAQLIAGRRLLGTPLEGPLSIAFALSLVPGVLAAVWYLRAYRKASRFFSLVAWLTLLGCAGFLAFTVLFVGA